MKLTDHGLTLKEQECMDALVKSFSIFTELPNNHPEETKEFVIAIHSIQGILATRIAKREYPAGWPPTYYE